jgi:hypothetical protein
MFGVVEVGNSKLQAFILIKGEYIPSEYRHRRNGHKDHTDEFYPHSQMAVCEAVASIKQDHFDGLISDSLILHLTNQTLLPVLGLVPF